MCEQCNTNLNKINEWFRILIFIALTLIALLVAGEECEVVVGTSIGSK